MNSSILNLFPGAEQIYNSADSYFMESPSSQQNENIPIEFLHTLNTSGLLVAHLQLKVGCPIIILRNIDPHRGLCNGTCAIILDMNPHVLHIQLLTGLSSWATSSIVGLRGQS